MQIYRSSHPEVFPGKVVLKIYSKFTGEYPCRSAISIKLLRNFIEIALQHGGSPVNLLHIFRTPFLKNTSGWLLLDLYGCCCFITLSQISCRAKNNFTRNVIVWTIFSQSMFWSKIYPFSYTKSKRVNNFIVDITFLNFFYAFRFSYFLFFNVFLASIVMGTILFLDGSHLVGDSFFISKENTL